MKKTFTAAACVILGIVGCTKDPNYSREQLRNVNQEITLFGEGITIPLDSVKTFMVKDILNPEETPQITVDENGCYCLNISGNLIAITGTATSRSKSAAGMEIKFQNKEIEINLPDILKDEGNKFNFADPGITVKINNPLNTNLTFSGKISAYREGQLKETAQFSNLAITKGNNEIRITEENCSNILKVINAVPDKLRFEDFRFAASGSEGIEVTGSNVSVDYQISTPFIFNAGTEFSAEKEMKNDIKIRDGMSIDKTEIVIEINNLTDMDLYPTATIDIDGEYIPLYDKEEGAIFIGKGKKKTVTCIVCKSDLSHFQKLGNISFGITASVSSGTGCMKKDSGIIMTIKSLAIPDGITVNEQ